MCVKGCKWSGDVGCDERSKVMMAFVDRGLRQDCSLSPLLNIYMIGMVEELEKAQLGIKLEDCWCGALIYADKIVLVADLGMELQTMLEVVQAYVMRWRIKFNSRKSKIVVIGKREDGMS